jgi:Aerotolerance regulator N-terminal/von Willebrand factor type A domain
MIYPFALWLFALAPVVVVLYLLKVSRRRRTVSALFLWRRVVEEQQRHALFHRLRNFWSLLLNLLILLCLILAATQLRWPGFSGVEGNTLLVIDNRARMQAKDAAGRTRLDVAKQLAANMLRVTTARNPTGLIILEEKPVAEVSLTDDVEELKRAVDAVSPSDTAGKLDDALWLAERILASRAGAKRILLLSDEPARKTIKGIEFKQVGLTSEPLDNIGIEGMEARSLPANPETAEVFVKAANFSRAGKDVKVELTIDQSLFDLKAIYLGPGESKAIIFSGIPSSKRYANSRGLIVARIQDQDALSTDNEAYALLPERNPARVLLVTSNNWFLENALQAGETSETQIVSPANYRSSLNQAFDVVIFDRELPAGVTLDTPGNLLFLGVSPVTPGTISDHPVIVETDTGDPLMRFVDLGASTILKATRLPREIPGWTVRVPVEGADGPLVLSLESSRRRRAIFAFDPIDSDLPVRVAFPLLIHNAVEWLANKSSNAQRQIQAGETLLLENGFHIVHGPLTAPGPGRKWSLNGDFHPNRNGFYELENGQEHQLVAVNTFDAAQSDLRSAGLLESDSGQVPVWPAVGRWLSWPPWIYFGLLAASLCGLEWWMYHRRRTE